MFGVWRPSTIFMTVLKALNSDTIFYVCLKASCIRASNAIHLLQSPWLHSMLYGCLQAHSKSFKCQGTYV